MQSQAVRSLSWRDLLLLVLAAILCCAQVVLPFLSDNEIYARGGQFLLDGGRLYTDFIDVKPPLIYELYGGWMALFGSSTMALRFMGACSDIVSMVLIFWMMYRHTGSRLSAHTASLAFVAYVASLWMPTTLQPETLAFIPIILLIRVGAKSSEATWKDAIVVGAMAGVLFTLKYPFVLVAVPIAWMVIRRSAGTIKTLILVIIAFTVVVAIVFGIVWHDGIIGALQQVGLFLSGYASTHKSFSHLLMHALTYFSDYFANDSSMLLTGTALVAIVVGMLRGGKRDALFVVTVTVLMALAASVIIERKFNLVHMVRVIPAMAILVAYGVPIVWQAFVQAWQTRLFSVPVFVVMAVIVLILSPLPRILRSTQALATVIAHNMPFSASHVHRNGIVDRFGMEPLIAAVTDAQPRSLVVLGLGGTLLYWHLPDCPPGMRKSKFADSHFFTSEYAPPAWQAEALVEASAADVLVLQDDDAHPRLSGHAQTTREALMARPAWAAMFATRRTVFDDGDMSVWVRR